MSKYRSDTILTALDIAYRFPNFACFLSSTCSQCRNSCRHFFHWTYDYKVDVNQSSSQNPLTLLEVFVYYPKPCQSCGTGFWDALRQCRSCWKVWGFNRHERLCCRITVSFWTFILPNATSGPHPWKIWSWCCLIVPGNPCSNRRRLLQRRFEGSQLD